MKNEIKIIRPKQLAEMLGVSTTTLWRMENRKELPQRRKISSNTVGWLSHEIENWLENTPKKTGIRFGKM